MDTMSMIKNLIGGVMQNPDLLGSLSEHPYSTIRQTSGIEEEIPRDQASQVLAAFANLASPGETDLTGLSGVASGMLADNGNSVHSLASSLFGGAAQSQPAQTNMLSNLANAVLGSELSGVKGIDLSDGFGVDDIVGLAKNLL